MKKIFSLYILIHLVACRPNAENYLRTIKLKIDCPKQLYVEIYKKWSFKSQYLTDSASFRLFVGDYDDEKEFLSYSCVRDHIIVQRKERVELNDNFEIVKDSILVLKKDKKQTELRSDTLITKSENKYSFSELAEKYTIK